MAENRVKKFRSAQKLSQHDLAKLAKTTQQQIQSVEAGAQVVRLEVAAAIAVALGKPLEMVFPAIKQSLKAVYKAGLGHLKDDDILQAEDEAGIDIDPRVWTFRFLLKNGIHRDVNISGAERVRLWERLQIVDRGFYVFDTAAERIALNSRHVVLWHFLFDPVNLAPKAEEKTDASRLHLNIWNAYAAEPWPLFVDPDELEFGSEDADEDAPLQGLFFDLESCMDDEELFNITDEDGETAFFRVSHVSMVSVPLLAVEVRLRKLDDEDND
jgi:transcriptional regulator with XRE-family HTH domain